MKKVTFLLGSFSLLFCLACQLEQREFKTYTYEQFLKTTSVGGGYFNADETKLLVHTNETGVYNIFSIDIATGERTQLTDSPETTFAVSYMPDDDRFLFTRDEGGNELNKLYIQEGTGEATKLTQGDKTREQFYGFGHDLKSFFTGNNSRDPRYFDVYEWEVSTLQPKLFYQNDDGLNLAAISDDKRWVALIRTHNRFDSDMYLADRQVNGEAVLISEQEGEVNHFPQTFTPDHKKLLYTTDKGSDFRYLMSYDLEKGEKEEIFRAEWDVLGAAYSHNGKYRVIYVNDIGAAWFHIQDTTTGEQLRIENLPQGDLSSLNFSRSENLMRFQVVNDDAPPNLFVYDVQRKQVKELTDNLNPEINPSDLVRSELVELTARDGLEFSGFLYKPKLAGPQHKVPALLLIHGGPGGQSRPTYDSSEQFLVNHGYAVFDLNYRGSSGFGRTFSMADDQKHGREPLWDCVDAKNWLIENVDWIDRDKIGIMGGSYGGYMVMAALAFTPEEFKVGVNIFGVTNWVRTLKSIPAWWESAKLGLYRELGNPETQEEMLYEASPLFHASRITRPVIVLQGANDPRVLQVESDEMVENIRQAGGVAEYVLFEDEGHGFTKNKNRIEGHTAILKFLDKYLKGVPTEGGVTEETSE